MPDVVDGDRDGLIDAHAHCWRWSELRTRWVAPSPLDRDHLPDTLGQEAARIGIRSVVLVDAGQSLPELMSIATGPAADGLVAAVVASLDLTAPSALRDVEALQGVPLVRAARMNVEACGDSSFLRRPSVVKVLRAVADAGLVWEFLVTAEQLPDVVAVLGRVPDLRAVIEHLGKPRLDDRSALDAWKRQIGRLATDTRASCKLSYGFRADLLDAIARERRGWPLNALEEPVAHVIDRFGPARICWGSDWPLAAFMGSYADALRGSRTLLAQLPETARHEVFRGHALDLYRIKTP